MTINTRQTGGPGSPAWDAYVAWLGQRGLTPDQNGVLDYRSWERLNIDPQTLWQMQQDQRARLLQEAENLPPEPGNPGMTFDDYMPNTGTPPPQDAPWRGQMPQPTPGTQVPRGGGQQPPGYAPVPLPGQQPPPGMQPPHQGGLPPTLPPNQGHPTGFPPGYGPQNPLAQFGYTQGPNGEVIPLMLQQGASAYQSQPQMGGLLGMPQQQGGLLGGGG